MALYQSLFVDAPLSYMTLSLPGFCHSRILITKGEIQPFKQIGTNPSPLEPLPTQLAFQFDCYTDKKASNFCLQLLERKID